MAWYEPARCAALRGRGFAYGAAPTLQAVRFAVPAGSACALVGPNGGGKSTALKLALGLLAPQRGRVQVLGTTPEGARPRVGYVPQFAQFQRDFPLSVRDVVLQGTLSGLPWAHATRLRPSSAPRLRCAPPTR
ncbi:MAG: ATP-binding cassette domain-containing protein [Burkholderiaceae bacterium]|nr:MAG: ATP-binding cassette domain-containing protein [Burkholderiaceae bacterium]